jgi:SWI/SNF-related matrix-associated actin-dependent regulator of chromatin subfamily A3
MMSEMVVPQRDPANQYDSNAIKVNNVRGELIGHIPRAVAAKLAPFMDSRKLLVEAETIGPKDHYECPIVLQLYGTNDPTARAILKQDMKAVALPTEELVRQERLEKARERARLTAAKERERIMKAAARKEGMSMPGMPGSSSQIPSGSGQWAGGGSQENAIPNLESIISESVRFNPRNIDQMVEQFGMKDDHLEKMDMASQPTMVKTQLLPYQLQVRATIPLHSAITEIQTLGKQTAQGCKLYKPLKSSLLEFLTT